MSDLKIIVPTSCLVFFLLVLFSFILWIERTSMKKQDLTRIQEEFQEELKFHAILLQNRIQECTVNNFVLLIRCGIQEITKYYQDLYLSKIFFFRVLGVTLFCPHARTPHPTTLAHTHFPRTCAFCPVALRTRTRTSKFST